MEQASNKPCTSVEYKCTTTKEIEQIIKSLKTKIPYGYAEISTKILKISCPFISSQINYIYINNAVLVCIPRQIKIRNNKTTT